MHHIPVAFARSILKTGLRSACLKLAPASLAFSLTSLRRLIPALLLFVLFNAIGASTVVFADASIDINSANASVLSKNLPGIGPAKAKAIIEYRLQHGAFTSIGSLINVKGIGPATLEKIRALLFISKEAQVLTGVGSEKNKAKSDGQTENHANSPNASNSDVAEELTTRGVRAIVDKARRQQSP